MTANGASRRLAQKKLKVTKVPDFVGFLGVICKLKDFAGRKRGRGQAARGPSESTM